MRLRSSTEPIGDLSILAKQMLRRYQVPGLAWAAMENGEIVHVEGVGWASRKESRLISQSTRFQVGSLSKSVTAWGVINLIRQGVLNLNDPVEKHLRRWKLPESEFDHRKVTISRILSHTAGLSVHGYMGVKDPARIMDLPDSLEGKGHSPQVRVLQEPGRSFRYSGGGYTLLQLVIEDVTGMPFYEYMAQEVFRPLDMTESTFIWDEKWKKSCAEPYGLWNRPIPRFYFGEHAAAGLYSTVGDLAKFMRAHSTSVRKKPVLLDNSWLSLMYRRMIRTVPYGLGYQVFTFPGNVKLVMHGGINRGWRSRLLLLPQRNDGFIVLSNSDVAGNVIRHLSRFWLEKKLGSLSHFYIQALDLTLKNRFREYLGFKRLLYS